MFAILDIVKDAPKHKKEIQRLQEQTKRLEAISAKASDDRAVADKGLRDIAAREAALAKKMDAFEKASSAKLADLERRESELASGRSEFDAMVKEKTKSLEADLAAADGLRRENEKLNGEAGARLSNATAREREANALMQKAVTREKIINEALDRCRSL
jgi:hypothetical protein